MAFFAQRPDGLSDVTLDDGTVVPMALTPDELEAQGIMPAPPMQRPAPLAADPNATASAEQLSAPVEGLPWQTPPPAAADVAPPAALAAPAAPPQFSRVLSDEEAAAMSAPKAAPGSLVAMPAPGASPSAPAGPAGADSSAIAQDYFAARMQPRYVAPRPERDQLVGYTQQTQAPLPEDRRAALEQSFDAKIAAAEDTQATAAQALDEASRARSAALLARQGALELEKERARVREQELTDLRRARDERRAAVPKEIDPNRWDRAGGLGRMLAAVSVAFGGYVQGLNGGSNPGMDLVRDIVRQDIEAQKEQIALAQDEADLAGNDYAQLLSRYGDPRLVDRQLELEGLDDVERLAQERVQAAQDEATKAAGRELLADLRMQKEQALTEWEGAAGTRVSQYQHQAATSGGYVAADPLKAAKDAAAFKGALDEIQGTGGTPEEKKFRGERQVRMADGSRAWAKDKDTASATQKVIEAHDRFRRNMGELETIVRESIGKSLSPEIRARVAAIVQQNKLLLKDTNELGAITEADQELVGPLSGSEAASVTSFDSATLAQIQEAQSYVDSQIQGRVRNLYRDPDLTRPVQESTAAQLGASAPAWER